MKTGFYAGLAAAGIRKNRKMYFPFILTAVGMIMMNYIINFLGYGNTVSYLEGADSIKTVLNFGGIVTAVFSAIFLFYTNSFLIRRRKKEFGLYNILGMNKLNIGKILFWEYLTIAAVSLCAGLGLGILFSKLAELGLVNMMGANVSYNFKISGRAVSMTAVVFGAIFVLLFLNTVRQVKFQNPIELLHSDEVGEKPPKANWFLGLLGVAVLAAGYYMALTAKDPVSAMGLFFVAVIAVIIATYLLFVAGSVLLCKILTKNRGYYYKPNHFVSVSSMAYRMKRSGAGLASICILATMVLVTVSSTTCLYFGAEDSLNTRYPKDINGDIWVSSLEDMSDKNIGNIRMEIMDAAEKMNANPEKVTDLRMALAYGILNDGKVTIDASSMNGIGLKTVSNIAEVNIVPLEDYNRLAPKERQIGKGEALIYGYRFDYTGDTLKVGNTEFKTEKIDYFPQLPDSAANLIPTVYIIVPDFENTVKEFSGMKAPGGNDAVILKWLYEFDTDLNAENQMKLNSNCNEVMKNIGLGEKYGVRSSRFESREANRIDYKGMFGAFLFLGIILSMVFILAAVLIIYYKQISEGYEDRARFEIMKNVGMTDREIKRSINSQLLTVFFAPLVAAGIHLAVAFPMIRKILLCFNLNNTKLFILTTVISFFVFALFYMIVYKVTSNTYYSITTSKNTD